MNESIAVFCVKAYSFLLPIAWIGVAGIVVVLLPLALFRSTRSFAGAGMFLASYLFGLTTWFLGAAVTFATWGWVALIIGVLLGGVGVVPIGILAAFITLGKPSLGFTLIVMTAIVIATRLGGIALTGTVNERAR
jgi:hypothetical protein